MKNQAPKLILIQGGKKEPVLKPINKVTIALFTIYFLMVATLIYKVFEYGN